VTHSKVTIKPIFLNGLLVALISIVLVPGAIVVASLILGAANESAGWLRYRLPEVFFWMFLATGLASPFLGIGTLVLLWTLQRRRTLVDGDKTELRMRRALILAAVTAFLAPAVWTLSVQRSLFRGRWKPLEAQLIGWPRLGKESLSPIARAP